MDFEIAAYYGVVLLRPETARISLIRIMPGSSGEKSSFEIGMIDLVDLKPLTIDLRVSILRLWQERWKELVANLFEMVLIL